MKLTLYNSPNQSARVHGDDAVRLVVCHTPEGSFSSALSTSMSDASDVSYHRLYRKNGTEAAQLVDFSRKAWHAGALNSLSDGLSIEGYARRFNLVDPGTREFARGVAERLVARKLPCQWTTDPSKGGFCRHGDLQDDRTDPTPDIAEWRLFYSMVAAEYEKLTAPPATWPKPIPTWFWLWAAWKLKGSQRGQRPASAPRLVKPWAWRRLRALKKARKQ